MKIKKTKFKDLLIIENQKYVDTRGEFRELIIEKEIKQLDDILVQRKV